MGRMLGRYTERRAPRWTNVFFVLAAALVMLALAGTPTRAQDGWAGAPETNASSPTEVDIQADPSSATPEAGSTGEEKVLLVLAVPKRVGIGQPFAVRLTSSRPLEDVSVSWEGKTAPASVSTWNGRDVALALLGTDVLQDKTGRLNVTVLATVGGEPQTFTRTVKIVSRKYPVQRLTVPEKMVTPPTTEYERIKIDRAHVAAALATISPERHWRLPLERPVDGDLSSPYGAQRILNGKPKNPHRGLDFRGHKGTPVKAVESGVVLLAEEHYYAGNSIYVDHGGGLISLYFHLSKMDVKAGDIVKRGQVIGRIGSTGRVTGPHLHLSISMLGRLVDPFPLFQGGVDSLLR